MHYIFSIVMLVGLQLYSESISLQDANIAYRGTLYTHVTNDAAVFYRFPRQKLFPKNLSERPSYSGKAASSFSGTSILIKTASPVVRMLFTYENANWAKFAIFQNDEFVEFQTLKNPQSGSLIIKNLTPCHRYCPFPFRQRSSQCKLCLLIKLRCPVKISRNLFPVRQKNS